MSFFAVPHDLRVFDILHFYWLRKCTSHCATDTSTMAQNYDYTR